jgi:carbonic anhydrase
MGFLWFGRKKKPRLTTAEPVSLDFTASPDVEVVVAGAVAAAAAALAHHPAPPTPDEALQMLRDGNAAFLSGVSTLGHVTAHDLDALQGAQHPIAVIVGCADSRTPPTILFNQGLGKLFIIRVAGNTVDRRGLSSIVYAVKHLHCPLVVVMGHTGCGAVAAAEAVVDGRAELDPSLEEMIVPILPAVLSARKIGGHSLDQPALARLAVEENARRVVARLLTADTALAEAVAHGTIRIVAAVKDMATGRVDFLDLPDAPSPAPAAHSHEHA